METESDDDKEPRYKTHLIWLSVVVVGLWTANLLLLTPLGNLEAQGQFGDKFGAVNALFSGLAFAGVIYAILLQRAELRLQRKDLKLSRDELALTREEIKGQKQQLEAQNESIRRHTFENTFFQMLAQWTSQIELIEVALGADYRETAKQGLAAIARQLRDVQRSDHDDISLANVAYEYVYSKHGDHLGHYFRGLYRIVKFVHVSDVENKRLYTGIVRAQLSSSELTLLLYNCISSHGKGFKPLVETYGMLKNLDSKYLLSPTHRDQYEPSAFQ